jgi:hypothetical protein
MMAKPIFQLGAVQGRVELPAGLASHAGALGAEHYERQAAQEFCGDEPESYLPPPWLPSIDTLVPAADLLPLGVRWTGVVRGDELLATVGVDQHIDDAYGLLLCIVLHNDGLTFRQGRSSIKPAAGDWFIFDDRLNHGVKEARGASTFVALVLPLIPA